MAKLSSDKKSVTVEYGDTLSGIAKTYLGDSSKYKQLASINGISNPNVICVGQVIKLYSSGGSSSTTSTKKNTNAVTIKQFGLQSNTERTLYATWGWDKHSTTEHYRVRWVYGTGDYVSFVGSDSTTTENQATYDIPDKASTSVNLTILPVAKKKKDANGNEKAQWTASWSEAKKYYINQLPPETPSAPTITIEDYKLTAELTLNVNDIDATHIEFRIIKDNTTVFKTGKATINKTTGYASYSCNVDAGCEYKVCCRAIRDKLYSEWSGYSSSDGTPPSAPSDFTKCTASSDPDVGITVSLQWNAVSNATAYDIEYATNKRFFDNSDQTTVKSGIEVTSYEIVGLESGHEYFFRVRAVNDKGESAWSGIKSAKVGKPPSPPTTWSSTTSAVVGENITLYWVHNSEDGSSQTYADLDIYINGSLFVTKTIQNSTDADERDKTSSVILTYSASEKDELEANGQNVILLLNVTDGANIQWKVRTAGITNALGDWSVERTIDIYAPPTLSMEVEYANGSPVETLTSFPFYISGLAGPNTQRPIGYHLVIKSNEVYETVDQVGNSKIINKDEEVYSKYFDITDPLMVEMSANNIDLENNIEYTVICVVAMNSGLTAEASSTFNVAWSDVTYDLNAEIAYDKETLVAHIRPYCEERSITYYEVAFANGTYSKTDTVLDSVWKDEEETSNLTNNVVYVGEQQYEVYAGVTPDGDELLYCEVETATIVEDVLLSIYRRESDGSFTELATNLDNTKNTFITDPHPALDYARYRIVARTESTGAVSYYDVPGYPIGEKAAIIQWDEDWSTFDISNEDPLAQPPWSGSLLRLPYNIDISDNRKLDISLVEYIGRKHPVSYPGTQVGETQNWKADIPKDDKETLHTLRRLSTWMGDVYVREPSGSGYWANISVSFSQNHLEVKIPVTINVTRVEGGI